jgi:hypothetical protein
MASERHLGIVRAECETLQVIGQANGNSPGLSMMGMLQNLTTDITDTSD